MGMRDSRTDLMHAARALGIDVDPDVLLAMVCRAFAPRETMTAAEREFLLASGAPADAFEPGRQVVARARLTAVAERTAQRAALLISTREVAHLLRRSASTVRRMAGAGDLYAISARAGELRYPTWQFVDGRPLPGLRAVLRELPSSMHPYSVEGWMTSPFEELDDRSPVDWLASDGEPGVVAELAESENYT